MGRRKGKGKAVAARVEGKGMGGATAEDMVEEAQTQMLFGNYDKAMQIMKALHQACPDNTEVLDIYGTVLAEVGMVDEAVSVLSRAVELSPDEGHEKYMYLSQLAEGEASLGYSRRGIEILRRAASREGEDAAYRDDLRGQLCEAICSLVETMLNIPGAASSGSEEALRLLEEARQCSPASPEPSLVKASLFVELKRRGEAQRALRDSMGLWYARPKSLLLAEGPGMDIDGGSDGGGEEDENHLRPGATPPSYEFRFETAKLVMELEDDARDSVVILGGLLEENDGNLDVWFLLSLAHQGMGQVDEAGECLDHVERAIHGFPADAVERENLRVMREDVEKFRREFAGMGEKKKMGEGEEKKMGEE
ncbi:TPR repeat domain-containing protein [Chloropicon primus]|uniref:Uncharacterized protein n=2 Tax=Chloropicon primus TaxID=1764295 RepID=A0A5B8MRQ5_9CHLO|nr:hypothetical protein A3770_09p56740 [Chloropicon primus]UPR02369.1 TPR repeat domain-containing protein [Chloropicon primus]|eukprot:QDZ23156.1 hypothetical protein A3770_09p56740 [Chloropicon primus]